MLDIRISEEKLSKMYVPAFRELNEEDLFSQVVSELAGMRIEPISDSITNAGDFAEKLASLYDLDIILIREKLTKRGSVSLVYWKKWSKFTMIVYKRNRSIYRLINYPYHQDTLQDFMLEFEKFDLY
ncbi:MAG: hypothetical protein ACXAD7_08375 [Candidatus Kariarchaeaceae archaeon]